MFSSPLLPLLSSLRVGREELESAERANACATARLEAARAAYDACARSLAGYVPFPGRKRCIEGGGNGVGGVGADAKRGARANAAAAGGAPAAGVAPPANATDAGSPPPDNDDDNDNDDATDAYAPPTTTTTIAPANELRLPGRHASGGGMDGAAVLAHRDEFSVRLSGGEANSSTMSS